jgi:hypothetical protein
MTIEVYRWQDITLPGVEDPQGFSYGDAAFTLVRAEQVRYELEESLMRMEDINNNGEGEDFKQEYRNTEKVLERLSCLLPGDLICFEG